jgi:CheY-like chemotaxis protein
MLALRLVDLGQGDGEKSGDLPGLSVTTFPSTFGRALNCELRLGDPRVSRRHCTFSLRQDKVWVEDLGSRNGTRLNGTLLTEARPLESGDQLTIGQTTYEALIVEATPPPKPPEKPKRVLVVEDDSNVAATLAILLRQWGHDVQVARDGAQALQAAQAQPPDAVLLDIHLPGMSGHEVARRLRAETGMDKAHLVAVTGDDPGAAETTQPDPAAFDQLLVKPVEPEALRKVLSRPA